MPALDTEAQFKFLMCCIKHSTAGKVNFEAVATELSIVSKAAAAKRYERLLKAHDISTAAPRKGAKSNADGDSGEGSEAGPKTPAPKKRKRAAAPTPASALSKRRDNEDDDEEVETPVKKERNLKKEESDEEIKVEGEDDGSSTTTTNTITNTLACRDDVASDAVRMCDIPEFPRPRPSSTGNDDGEDDDYCVVGDERPVLPPAPAIAPTAPVAHAHLQQASPLVFGRQSQTSIHGANLGLPPQTITCRSNPSLKSGTSNSDATPSSFGMLNWTGHQYPALASSLAQYHQYHSRHHGSE